MLGYDRELCRAATFDAFRRGRTDADPLTGHLGLGLYISAQIVRSHGGKLTVRSSDGTTMFCVAAATSVAFIAAIVCGSSRVVPFRIRGEQRATRKHPWTS